MLIQTSSLETRAHRWPVGPKLAALALFVFALFRLTDLPTLALAAAPIAALSLAGGPAFARAALKGLRPLWPLAVLIGLWHLATADAVTGLALILRMGTAVAAANLFSMTTRLADLMALVERFSAPLSRLGLPPARLALAIGLALRFVPVFLTRLGQIGDALRARSPRRPGWRVLAPATLAALDDADRVAEALRARGGVD